MIQESVTSVKQLRNVKEANLLPEYVQPMLQKVQTSQNVRANNGRSTQVGTNDLDCIDENNEQIDDGQGNNADIRNDEDDYQEKRLEENGIVEIIDTQNYTSFIEGTYKKIHYYINRTNKFNHKSYNRVQFTIKMKL